MAVTVTAQWTANVYNFDYTGGQQTFIVPATGYYKLEVWGAGAYSSGGYAVGVYKATKSATLYVNVGGNGKNTNSGGYNGGGASGNSTHPNRSGGGATHIGTRSGVLSSLSSYKSTVLIVAGGAGGPADCVAKGENGAGGGISGNGVSLTWDGTTHSLSGANQSGGYAFGQGQPGHSPGGGGCADGLSGGGGGGWYGGYASQYTDLAGSMAGSGGSGYIGNSSLISGGGITKHMTCYSCTTSTVDSTRTNSNTNVSATATADYSKTGNGYARITYLGTSI